jgi:peptidoglycan/LPS O-acetylase OafA/YrhL
LRYRLDIDGVRAIAVTSVVLFHAGLPVRSGFVGVDIFFVISGYLIGGIILRETTNGHFDFAGFYARRARRILPALFLVVLLTCLIGWFLLSASEYRAVGSTALASLLAVSNFSFWQSQDYFAIDAGYNPLLMTWSLGVEEQFYISFPFLVIAMNRLAPRRVLIALGTVTLASFILALWWIKFFPMAAFYLLPARAWELGVGGTLAAWEHKQGSLLFSHSKDSRLPWVEEALAWLGLTLLAVSAIAFDETVSLPGLAVVLAVLGTALLINTQTSWVNTRLLSNRPIVFVGLISYSWYLWHWPLMSYLRVIAPSAPSRRAMVLVTAISFVLAIVSWWFVERPFRRVRLGTYQTLRRYAFASAIALAFPVAITMGDGLAFRLSDATKQLEAIDIAGRHPRCLVGGLTRKPDLSEDCVVLRKDRPAVALIGDSIATAIAPAIRELADHQNLGLRIFAHGGCPPLLNVSIERKPNPGFMQACAAFVREVLGQLVSDLSVKGVVLAGAWPWYLSSNKDRFVDLLAPELPAKGIDLLRKGLKATVDLLIASNKQIILVELNPSWNFDPYRLELAKTIPLRNKLARLICAKCDYFDTTYASMAFVYNADYIGTIRNLHLESHQRIRYLDLWSKFCDSSHCTFKNTSGLFFSDGGHLSAYGARYAVEGMTLLSNQ